MESVFNISYYILITVAAFFVFGLLPYDVYRRIKATDLKECRMLEQIIALKIILSFLLFVLIFLMHSFHE